MKTQTPSSKKEKAQSPKAWLAGSLSLLVFSQVSLLAFGQSPALAEELSAGKAQSLSGSPALGSDEDSLLPPEVVPLNTQAANIQGTNFPGSGSQMSSQSRLPGAGNPMLSPSQEMRKQAYDQLLNQGPLPKALLGGQPQARPSQIDLTIQDDNVAGQAPQSAFHGNPVNTQSQTLSGSVRSTTVKGNSLHNTGRLSGLSRLAMLGTGAMMLAGGLAAGGMFRTGGRGGFYGTGRGGYYGSGVGNLYPLTLVGMGLTRPASPVGMGMVGYGLGNLFRRY